MRSRKRSQKLLGIQEVRLGSQGVSDSQVVTVLK